jgi:tetratricopeptide (TPR) repeat protein
MNKKKFILSAVLVLAVTFAALSPALIANFSNWDDQIMITQNAKITGLDWQHVKIWFTTLHERLYHPLVHMSYAIEYHFFGLNPHVFHATNLALHLFNTLFVLWFIFMLSRNRTVAVITALLFGIHPMHVESVLWLSERKDVLYSFFFLGSLISYLYFLKEKKERFYYLSIFIFILSLLSKSMAITLPFILLLCDYILNKKIDKDNLIGKLPFFALSLVFAVVTVLGHYEPGVKGREFSFSFIGNFVSACQNLVFYLIKLFLPFQLSCIYPTPDRIQNIPQIIFFFAPLIVIALIAVVVCSAKYSKIGIFGSLFFLVTIAPVTQILPVGLVIPADRYTYIPYIGLFYIFAEGCLWAYKRYDRKAVAGILMFMFLALSILAFERALVWRDSIPLWDNAIQNYKNVALAYYNRGDEYFLRKNDYEKALSDFRQTIMVDPEDVNAFINIGLIFYFKHDYRNAIFMYDKSIEISDKVPEAYLNRGNAMNALGKYDAALGDYAQAMKMRPSYLEAWLNRGNLYMKTGKLDKAISDFNRAIEISPGYANAYNNRGNAYFRKGDLVNAYLDFTRTIQCDPGYADAYYNRAVISSMRGDAASALSDVLKARTLGINIDPQVIEKLRKAAGTK